MRVIKNIEEFDEVIEKKVLVDFYADWCGPCKMLKPILESVEDKIDYEIVQVNVDNLRSVALKYRIMSIPSLKVFENKKIVKEKTGFMTEHELLSFLND